jgi:hypothetical protein
MPAGRKPKDAQKGAQTPAERQQGTRDRKKGPPLTLSEKARRAEEKVVERKRKDAERKAKTRAEKKERQRLENTLQPSSSTIPTQQTPPSRPLSPTTESDYQNNPNTSITSQVELLNPSYSPENYLPIERRPLPSLSPTAQNESPANLLAIQIARLNLISDHTYSNAQSEENNNSDIEPLSSFVIQRDTTISSRDISIQHNTSAELLTPPRTSQLSQQTIQSQGLQPTVDEYEITDEEPILEQEPLQQVELPTTSIEIEGTPEPIRVRAEDVRTDPKLDDIVITNIFEAIQARCCCSTYSLP